MIAIPKIPSVSASVCKDSVTTPRIQNHLSARINRSMARRTFRWAQNITHRITLGKLLRMHNKAFLAPGVLGGQYTLASGCELARFPVATDRPLTIRILKFATMPGRRDSSSRTRRRLRSERGGRSVGSSPGCFVAGSDSSNSLEDQSGGRRR